jgi:hypothetical protein
MCIACELGYWSMVDAIEADRASSGRSKKKSKEEKSAQAAAANDAQFVCDAAARPEPPNEPAS